MRPHRYRIIVSGRPGKITREVFEDLCVEDFGANTGLTGELDQAALYGVLNRILAFGLELVALGRLDDEALNCRALNPAVSRSVSTPGWQK